MGLFDNGRVRIAAAAVVAVAIGVAAWLWLTAGRESTDAARTSRRWQRASAARC